MKPSLTEALLEAGAILICAASLAALVVVTIALLSEEAFRTAASSQQVERPSSQHP